MKRKGVVKPLVISMLAASLIVYLAGYAWLRLNKTFVRNGTYWTEPSGHVVRTDTVELSPAGIGYYDPAYLLLSDAYLPLRWLESRLWQMRP